jgi:hypothetical protein
MGTSKWERLNHAPTIDGNVNTDANQDEKRHTDLVRKARQHIIANEPMARRFGQSPEEWVGLDLFRKWRDAPTEGPRREFFEPLFYAWNVITYDRLEPGSGSERSAARIMADYCREPTIKLSDSQMRLIDALAAAAGIERQRGQIGIPIPEKYRDFDRWTSSPEYQERLARAQASRKK